MEQLPTPVGVPASLRPVVEPVATAEEPVAKRLCSSTSGSSGSRNDGTISRSIGSSSDDTINRSIGGSSDDTFGIAASMDIPDKLKSKPCPGCAEIVNVGIPGCKVKKTQRALWHGLCWSRKCSGGNDTRWGHDLPIECPGCGLVVHSGGRGVMQANRGRLWHGSCYKTDQLIRKGQLLIHRLKAYTCPGCGEDLPTNVGYR